MTTQSPRELAQHILDSPFSKETDAEHILASALVEIDKENSAIQALIPGFAVDGAYDAKDELIERLVARSNLIAAHLDGSAPPTAGEETTR